MDMQLEIPFITVILAGIFSVCVYWYFIGNLGKHKPYKGIPFIKSHSLIDNIQDIFSEPTIEETEIKRYTTYGRIFRYFEGDKPILNIAEPELIKALFVKDFVYFPNRRVFSTGDEVHDKMLTVVNAEDWKRIRSIVSPTFSTGKLKRLLNIFEDSSKTFIQNFKMALSKGDSIDIVRICSAFTMDVIASSAFSTKIDSHNNPENEFVQKAKAIFRRSRGFKVVLVSLISSIMKNFGFHHHHKPEKRNFFKDATLAIIEERKRTGQTRNDFLQLLLDASIEQPKEDNLENELEDFTKNYGDDSSKHPIFKNISSHRMSMNELIAQCIVFFLAGYHTTTTTLSLAIYLLAIHEDEQERVYKEMKDVLAETNGELKYESVLKCKYLDNVISETLRLYPPVLRLDRTANEDYKLGDKDIEIKKGSRISVPVYAMHHDPDFFPNPEKFQPTRFSQESKEKLIPYTYLPFGTGPRNCVGMRFALLEIKVGLLYILSAFRIKKSALTEEPVDFEKGSGLLQPKSIHLVIEPREDNILKC